MPSLKITEVVIVHWNIVMLTTIINKFQESSIHLLLISRWVNYWIFLLKTLFFKKRFDSKSLYIEVWFTDQNSKPLEIEDEINIMLLIKF